MKRQTTQFSFFQLLAKKVVVASEEFSGVHLEKKTLSANMAKSYLLITISGYGSD